MLQTSEISPFIYKNNVIQRLKFYWIKYKSQRSAVGGRRSAVGGYTRTNQILYHLIKLLLVITPSIFIRLTHKYHHLNPLIEMILNEYKITKIGSSVSEISRKFSNYYIYTLCKS